MIIKSYLYLLALALAFVSCGQEQTVQGNKNETTIDYMNDIEVIQDDSTFNVVIEIPLGTRAKYEYDKTLHQFVQDSIDGKPRHIDYLPYPFNYGFVPATLLPKETGGDGDPLDVIVLGDRYERSAIVNVRMLGVMRLMDTGQQDDKLLAVDTKGYLSHVQSLGDLEASYEGLLDLIKVWFENYKGQERVRFISFEDEQKAYESVERAFKDYGR